MLIRQYVQHGLLLISLCGLSACGVMSSFDDSNEGIKSAEQRISMAATDTSEDAAIYVQRPAPNLEPIKEPEGPEWVNQPMAHDVEVAGLSIDQVMDLVLTDTGIVAQLDYNVDPNFRLSLSHKGSVRDALNKIASLTNYSYEVSDTSVHWSAYETEMFTLPIPPGGDYSYMVGKKKPRDDSGTNGGSGEATAIDTSAFDVDRDQFSNTQAEGLNPFTDAKTTIESIVGDYGVVVPSKSSSTILVKTTPDLMRTVRAYMAPLIDELSAQVVLEVKVLQVTTENNAEVGLDWSAVKNTASSQLNFFGESPFGVFTNDAPIAFSGSRQTGSSSIDVLVKALEQQGRVSFVTEQRVMTRSGSVAEVELADIEGYLAASRTTNTTDVGSTTELIPGILQGGYTLYSMTKVFDNDRVSVVLSNSGAELNPTETVGTETDFIQLPRLKRNRFNIQQIVSDGTTVVAAAVRREENMSKQDSPIKTGWASTSAGAKHRVTDIYLLVTPRIIRNI
jgi:type IVB pilus formation R64 PilN family outer membrane protein